MTQRNWFRVYCEKTTSHCMQYFVMKKRSPAEKLYWILVFICMTSIAFSAISLLFNVWIHSPTVMFIENTESEIQEIPFPSITICSSNQLRKSTWEKHKNKKGTYWENLQNYRTTLCNLNTYTPNSLNRSIENFEYKTFQSVMMNCAVSCSEMFQFPVEWQNRSITNICNFVQPIISVMGLCYSINMVPSYEMLNEKYSQRYKEFFSKNYTYNNTDRMYWNLDDGYSYYSQDNVLLNVIPARTSGVSYYNRLKLRLFSLGDEFLSCPDLSFTDGYFLIVITSPANYYMFDTRYIIVPETHTKIQITPVVKKIHSDLKWRSLEVRKCYLKNERKLLLFQEYTEANCFNECSLNETISTCDCIGIEAAFLVIPGVKICGSEKIDCVIKAKQVTLDPGLVNRCNCLPTCSMVDYDVTATSNIERWDYLKRTNVLMNKSRGATIEFAFKHPYYTAYETASILSFSTLISTVGGIFSLILGINLLNIFEILYVIVKMINYYVTHMFDN